MGIEALKTFTVFVRYDDTLSGAEQSRWEDGVRSDMANADDLVAGGDTRVGVDEDGVGLPADGLIGPIIVWPKSLTNAQVTGMAGGMAVPSTEAAEGRYGIRFGRWRQLVR